MKILHISDIHFGRNHTTLEEPFEKHDIILNQLKDKIVFICSERQIDHIVVTGDIAWFGKKKEFDEALEWFKLMLYAIGKTGSDISVCVGNHDVNRSCAVPIELSHYYDEKGKPFIGKIDELYRYENISKINASIHNYNEFCEELGILPYQYPVGDEIQFSYAVGYKDIVAYGETLRLVALDTAVFSFTGNMNEEKMWLGAPQIESLIASGILNDNDSIYRVALFHHAERFLDPNEICEYDGRKATYDLLLNNVDLALCGHTETNSQPGFYVKRGAGSVLTGGAIYYNDEHSNSFSIIYSVKNENDQKDFYSDSYYYEEGWKRYGDRNFAKTEIAEFQSPLKQIHRNAMFELSFGQETYPIEIKYLTVEQYGAEKVRISNKSDLLRWMDIEADIKLTTERQNINFKLDLSKDSDYSVEATLEKEKYYQFINRNVNRGEQGEFAISLADSQILASSSVNSFKDFEVNSESIEILERIRILEKFYDVLFVKPKELYDYDMNRICVLENIMNNGMTTEFQFTSKIEVLFSSVEKMKELLEIVRKKNAIQLYYKGVYEAIFWGATIKLGEKIFYTEPYMLKDIEDLEYKIQTYRDGDQRILKLEAINGSKMMFGNSDKIMESFVSDYVIGLPLRKMKDNSQCYKFDFVIEK